MRKIIFILVSVLCSLSVTYGQNVVTGVITGSEDGLPIPGVAITIEDFTGYGAISDATGKYSLTLPNGATTLVFSFVGMKTQKIPINDRNQIDVVMHPTSEDIDEVIVIGYGTQKKSLVTGAIAKVDGDEIAKGVNFRINEAMQGKSAGVVVTNNSGQPGSFVSVRVRGNSTNGNAEPLYIVDGLPLNGNSIDFLNPTDVESIEVLKDAASAAIYGARGANGVVLITTKKGKSSGRFQVNYDGYYGLQNPWRKLDVLNSDEYVLLMNEAAANAGLSPLFDQAMMDTLANTDWQDQMFYYNAPITSHVLSFSGGTEKAAYSSSISYLKQDGIVAKNHSYFERFTYRLNTSRKFGLLEIGSNINYANMENKGISANSKFAAYSLAQALNMPPIVPVTYADGTYATPTDYGVGIQEITNPVAVLNYTNNKTKTHKFIGNIHADFNFGDLFKTLDGLKFRSSLGTELSYVQNNNYTPEYYIDNMHTSPFSRIGMSIDKYTRWNFENVLSYNKTFKDNHFSALLGHASFKYTYQNIGGSRDNFIFDDFAYAYIDNTTDNESAVIYGGFNEHTLLSYFGRVNYDYKNTYMLSATVRKDGSSRFGSENKFGYFPSVSAGWIISHEDFFSEFDDILSFAKIRASWGQNGNEEIGDFGYTSVMGNGSIYFFGVDQTQYNGVVPTKISNPSLKWETSVQTDIGVDLRFLKNSLNLTLDYYIKTTKDWLVDAPAPLMLGNVPPTINGGSVKNSGIEIEFIAKKQSGNFFVEAALTGAFNKNEVLEIKNVEKKLQGGEGGFGQSGILYASEKTALGVFYGIKTDGIFQNQNQIDEHVSSDGTIIQPSAVPGDIKFIDANDDGKIDDLDRVVLGDPYPDFTGGINLSIEWKEFDFNMFWYAAIGHQVWNATRRYDLLYANYRGDALNRWTGEGTSNDYPRVTLNDANSNFKTPSDFYIEDTDFIRLRNITLGYTLPENITKLIKIRKLRIYLSAENLLTFTKYSGYDPEIGGDVFSNAIDNGIYPQPRTILGGINITF